MFKVKKLQSKAYRTTSEHKSKGAALFALSRHLMTGGRFRVVDPIGKIVLARTYS